MVLPDEIRSARQEGEIQTVVAWLDANEYANDDLATLLTDICFDHHITEADVDIARLLRKARSASGTVWHTQLAYTS